MKRKIILLSAMALSFGVGMAVNSFFGKQFDTKTTVAKVTGIGGIFFKCKNPSLIKKWYHENLGMETDEYGANFEWRQVGDTTIKGFTQWSPFSEKTTYFEPSTKDFMINYRVVNLEKLVNDLRNKDITILDTIETFEYGKFIHILDIEGNKIELWEPNDFE